MAGLGIGVIRMGFTWSRADVPCGSTDPDTRFDIVYNVGDFDFMEMYLSSFIVALLKIRFNLTFPCEFSFATQVHYMHFACILLGCTAFIIILVSFMTEPRTEAQVSNRQMKSTYIYIYIYNCM